MYRPAILPILFLEIHLQKTGKCLKKEEMRTADRLQSAFL
jgi:hypothetical protein